MNVTLLNQICKAIEREPRRFNMGDWISLDPFNDVYLPGSEQAPCGTTACIAGFAVMLDSCGVSSSPNPGAWRSTMLDIVENDRCPIDRHAKDLLDLTEDQSDLLFYATAWPESFRNDYHSAPDAMAKARVAILRIKHFIETEGTD